jgi:predicted ATPase
MAAQFTEVVGGRYQILELVGKGGMGVVYRAYDRLKYEEVALKQVLVTAPLAQPNSLDGHDHLIALAREFRLLAGLRHPNIVPVLDYGFDANHAPYYTMNFLRHASDIRSYGVGRSDIDKTRLMTDALQALAYLHRRGVVHRDLKPANVLVDTSGHVLVMDFGLAILPDSSSDYQIETAGTMAYMAPELFSDAPASFASDLYAIGIMMYELWVGRHPFASQHGSFMLMEAISKDADVSSLPSELADLMARLLAKNPDERPQDAGAVIGELCLAMNVPAPAETIILRESFLQASNFIGREQELAQLRTALQSTLEGETSLLLVGGESGVGKSRLLDELRARALVQGALVLQGQAMSGGGLPYQLWREIARRLVLDTPLDDLEAAILKSLVSDIEALIKRSIPDAPELSGKAYQDRIVFTLMSLLKRQNRPLVLLLEDLQWADESLDPLRQLLLIRDQMKHLLVVATYRDDERPDLPEELSGMKLLKLPRLNQAAVEALTQAMLGAASAQNHVVGFIQQQTEGNAFFIVETVRALAEEAGSLAAIGNTTLPTSIFAGGVQRIIQRRLNQMPQLYRPLLKLAAVAGRQFDKEVLAHLAPETDIDAFLLAGANISLFELTEGEWRFSHDKLREGLLHTLAADEVITLNRTVAQATEAAHSNDSAYNEVLLDYWRAAQDSERELYYLLIVVENLVSIRSDYKRAEGMIARGLALLDSQDVRASHLLTHLSQCEADRGEYEAAQEHALAALQIAEAVQDSDAMLQSWHQLAFIAQEQRQLSIAEDWYQKYLSATQARGDKRGIARGFNGLGVVAAYQGDNLRAEKYFEQSLALFRDIDSKVNIAQALNNLGISNIYRGNVAKAGACFAESLVLYELIGHQRGLADCLVNLGISAAEAGNFATAHTYFSRALTIIREIGTKRGIAVCLANLGALALDQNDFEAARAYLEESKTLYQALGNTSGVANSFSNLGDAALGQGDMEAAHDYYQQSITLFRQLNDSLNIAETLQKLVYWSWRQRDEQFPVYAREGLALSVEHQLVPIALLILTSIGQWAVERGLLAEAVRLAGFIDQHSAISKRIRQLRFDAFYADLKTRLPADEFAQVVGEDSGADLETIAQRWLARMAESSAQ